MLQQNGKLRPDKAHHFNHYLRVNNYWAKKLRISPKLKEGLGICLQIQSHPNQILEELLKLLSQPVSGRDVNVAGELFHLSS